jgi:hypothetical protein
MALPAASASRGVTDGTARRFAARIDSPTLHDPGRIGQAHTHAAQPDAARLRRRLAFELHRPHMRSASSGEAGAGRVEAFAGECTWHTMSVRRRRRSASISTPLLRGTRVVGDATLDSGHRG